MVSASVPTSRFLPWAAALGSLDDGQRQGRISQVNAALPYAVLLSRCFVIATEKLARMLIVSHLDNLHLES